MYIEDLMNDNPVDMIFMGGDFNTWIGANDKVSTEKFGDLFMGMKEKLNSTIFS